jgi:hypothetical protein
MTVLVDTDVIIESISILTVVIRTLIKFDVDNLRDCFRQEVMWTLAIRYQLSTLSVLDLDRVQHLPHAVIPDKDTYCLPEANQ